MHFESDPFLNSRAWKEKRRRILARDGYMCQYSKRYGKKIEGNIVHHIFPRAEYPEYRLASWNLITVCAAAHNRLESESGLTDEGVELLRRTARKNGIPIPEPYR